LCKIPITTPTQRFPRNLSRAPRRAIRPPAIHSAETPSAAMRSGPDLRPRFTAAGRSGSPARFLNRADRILFQNHCIAGCVLLRSHGMGH
jgi:hypothetical protein